MYYFGSLQILVIFNNDFVDSTMVVNVISNPLFSRDDLLEKRGLALSQIRDETSVRVSLEDLNYLSTISSVFSVLFPLLHTQTITENPRKIAFWIKKFQAKKLLGQL